MGRGGEGEGREGKGERRGWKKSRNTPSINLCIRPCNIRPLHVHCALHDYKCVRVLKIITSGFHVTRLTETIASTIISVSLKPVQMSVRPSVHILFSFDETWYVGRCTEWAKKVSCCIAGCNFVNCGPIFKNSTVRKLTKFPERCM